MTSDSSARREPTSGGLHAVDDDSRLRIRVGEKEDFPIGRFTVITLPEDDQVLPQDREIGIMVTAEGRWYAVRNVCPHRGGAIARGEVRGTRLPSKPGELSYGRDGELLVCPWHHHEFDLETGKCQYIGSNRRLVKYRVDETEGSVYVELRKAKV